MANEETELFRANAPQKRILAEQSAPKTGQPAAEVHQQVRQLLDSSADQQGLGDILIGRHTPDTLTENAAGFHDADSEAQALAAKQAQLVMPVIKKEEEAVPWAIAIDLQRRLQQLTSTTAAVHRELDALEASSNKLAKRMTS